MTSTPHWPTSSSGKLIPERNQPALSPAHDHPALPPSDSISPIASTSPSPPSHQYSDNSPLTLDTAQFFSSQLQQRKKTPTPHNLFPTSPVTKPHAVSNKVSDVPSKTPHKTGAINSATTDISPLSTSALTPFSSDSPVSEPSHLAPDTLLDITCNLTPTTAHTLDKPVESSIASRAPLQPVPSRVPRAAVSCAPSTNNLTSITSYPHRYHAAPTALPSQAHELPLPLSPLPLITVSEHVSFLARNQQLPPAPEHNFIPFGCTESEQKHTFSTFFQAMIHLAENNDAPTIEKILYQLGSDSQKYHLTHKNIVHTVKLWQNAFAPIAEAEFVGWIGSFSRAICAGLAQPIPVYNANVIDILRPEPDYMVIRLLSTEPIPYASGQYCEVLSSRHPDMWKYCLISSPSNPLGQLDIHLRGLSHIFTDTCIDDQWYIGQIHGNFAAIADAAHSLTLIGADIGISALQSIVLHKHLHKQFTPTRMIGITYTDFWFEKDVYEQISHSNYWLELYQINTLGVGIDADYLMYLMDRPTDQFIISAPQRLTQEIISLLLSEGIKPSRIASLPADIFGLT